jgi:stage II sporulation protein D
VASCTSVQVGQKGKSGRAVTLLVDGTTVNAARLRISLGSTKMRSTLLTELSVEGNVIQMSGRGYGHGVGMPQWGAYALAKAGMSGEEISLHYYNGLRVAKIW